MWGGDPAGVRSVLASLDDSDIHGRLVDLGRMTLRAALAALDGDRDAAAREYSAILPELADACPELDWSKPLTEWSRETIIEFLLKAMPLIRKAVIARDLSAEYEVPLPELAQHVVAYVSHLSDLGLIIPVVR